MTGPNDPSPDEMRLIAYLDGEADAAECADIERLLEQDPALRAHALRLAESASLLRSAFDEVLREPLPERLIAAARGETAAAVVDMAGARRGRWGRHASDRRWWIGVPMAASLAGLMLGGGLGYHVGSDRPDAVAEAASGGLPTGAWLDNVTGYHKLFVDAGQNDEALVDVPAQPAPQTAAPQGGDAQPVRAAPKLPADVRPPNLTPWGLAFQGARFLVVDGRRATQLFYAAGDQAKAKPLTLVVGVSARPDLPPTHVKRGEVNLIYWRRHYHAYALVGAADEGYMWNLAEDVARQLDPT
jgi:anti-sigma factor RsiW